MTVYGYVRVSTTEQVDNTSMHEQRRQIEGNALTHNLVIGQFIEDGGVSGADPFFARLEANGVTLAEGDTVIVATVSAIYGIGIMMVRPDVKRALAGSTVSQMGFMIMSCGLGAYAAALWHIIAHGLFKAWLFLGSGSTIGMKSGKPAPTLVGRVTLTIAAGTIGVAISILYFGDGDAGLVPLLLGLATAVSTLVASLGGKLPMRAKVTLMLTLAALIAFHSAGLALAGMAVGADAAALVPGWALLALLIVFLGAWAWQQQRVSTGRGLPLPLYVHLINAGTLPAAGKGEEK